MTDISYDLPRFFEGNILMVGFLLWNIAEFTQKYIGIGGVNFDIYSEAFKRHWHSVYFSFTVLGLGIPLAMEEKLFQPNHKKKPTKRNRVSNLYYAGIITKALDGIIRIENKVGFGTKYMVQIRLQAKS